jgi:hypothetical protein
MSPEPGIVDTNILVYAMAADAPQYAVSRALLDVARDDPATTIYVTSQILCEFYSVVTSPRRVTQARSTADALQAISGFLAFLHVLPIPASAVEGWMDLLRGVRWRVRMFLICSSWRRCWPMAFHASIPSTERILKCSRSSRSRLRKDPVCTVGAALWLGPLSDKRDISILRDDGSRRRSIWRTTVLEILRKLSVEFPAELAPQGWIVDCRE